MLRRSFLAGLGSLLAALAIVRVENIMPVKALDDAWWNEGVTFGYVITKTSADHVQIIQLRDLLLPGLREIVQPYYSLPHAGWSDTHA